MSSEEGTASPAGRAPQAKKPRSRGHVTIFPTWCKGCGICVAFCPRGVLASDSHGHSYVAHPESCTACHWCDTHCPDMAITVRRLDSDEVEELEELIALAEQGVLPAGGALSPKWGFR